MSVLKKYINNLKIEAWDTHFHPDVNDYNSNSSNQIHKLQSIDVIKYKSIINSVVELKSNLFLSQHSFLGIGKPQEHIFYSVDRVLGYEIENEEKEDKVPVVYDENQHPRGYSDHLLESFWRSPK